MHAGQACTEYHKLGIPTYGVYLRATDKGQFLAKLRAYPEQNIRVSARQRPCLPLQYDLPARRTSALLTGTIPSRMLCFEVRRPGC